MKVALRIVPVVVSDTNNCFSMNVFALLDNGANGTFCSKKLIHALRLETQRRSIKLSTMESKNVSINTLAVDLQVEDCQRRETYLMKGVLSREHLNTSLNNLITVGEVSQWPHLQDIADDICPGHIDIADEVHLLIGLNQPDVLDPHEVRRGSPREPHAALTGLEWTHNGPVSEGYTAFSANFMQPDSTLQQTEEKFWKLEDPVHLKDEPLSVTDREVLELWKKNITKEDGHYVLPILFEQQLPQLSNNYQAAKHRLDLLGKRLVKDPELKQRYTESIHVLLQKGYAEEVSDTNGIEGTVWYLPHHPVLSPHKPGKVRVVYD